MHLTFVTHVKERERIVFFLFSEVQRVHKHVVLWLKQSDGGKFQHFKNLFPNNNNKKE